MIAYYNTTEDPSWLVSTNGDETTWLASWLPIL